MNKPLNMLKGVTALIVYCIILAIPAMAQVAPSRSEVAQYTGLHAAAHSGDLDEMVSLIKAGADVETRDSNGRTPLLVAAFASQDEAVSVLAKAGADMNALDHSAYDCVTIASVANDVEMVELALTLGNSAGNITSPYDGTALIAAAHLGHVEVVQQLINGKAPLDHINNLGWTALIEAVVLGNGGANHIETVRALVIAGANKSIADRQGMLPIQHAKERGYTDIVNILQ